MSGILKIATPDRPQHEDGRSRAVFSAAVILVAIVTAFLFWPRPDKIRVASTGGLAAAFGPEERVYAQKIQFENLGLSRAENFLHQEVTILSGDVINGGSRPLVRLQLTIEFFDDLHQIVLRDTRPALELSQPALAPGERRTFEVSFEHVSSSWDMREPNVRVSGLQFASVK